MNKDQNLIAEAYTKVQEASLSYDREGNAHDSLDAFHKANVAKEQSLGKVLSSYYHEGKGLDNDTLHDVIVELEEILNVAKNDPDPASALESLIGKLKVD